MADEEKNVIEEVVDAVEETVDNMGESIQETSEELAENASSALEIVNDFVEPQAAHTHHYTDEVVLPYFGSIGSMPGGIYTFIFIVLGIITLVEVLITEALPDNAVTITLLVVLSLAKAYLVMMYYMHLNNDNPLYRLVVILPLLIVLLSTLYLIGAPAGSGLGYN
ncbi:MAG: cytochrome C oxidase subunit IV family protein [Phototrophicaceae bacterium]